MLNKKSSVLKNLVILGITGVLAACGGGGGGDDGPVFDPKVAPQNVQVVAGEAGENTGVMNTVSWADDPTATAHVVYWSNTSGVTESSDVVVPIVSDLNYVVHEGIVGNTYYYKVQASAAGESSVLSAEVKGTPQVSITSNHLNDVAWNGADTLVAVGDSGVILSSPNGTADGWTEATPTSTSLSGVTWEDVNNQFLIVGAGGTVLTGDVATGWILQETPVDSDLEDVAWLGDGYIAVGKNGTIITTTAAVSNGSEWEQQTTPATVTAITLTGVASNGNRIVVVGTNGTMLTSDDAGINWTELAKITNNNLNDITWDGARFGVVGSNTTILSSTDGINWTEHVPSLPVFAFIGAVQWDSSIPAVPILAAVGASGNFVVSPESVNGYKIATGTDQQLSAITWVDGGVNNTYFVIVGHDGTVLTNQHNTP